MAFNYPSYGYGAYPYMPQSAMPQFAQQNAVQGVSPSGSISNQPMQNGFICRPVTSRIEAEADKYVSCLVGADGTEGGHWTPGQISQIRAQKAPECDFISLFATMNMLYSDYSEVAKKHGVDNTDFYIDMAKAFLEDPDGRPDKISAYIHCMGK